MDLVANADRIRLAIAICALRLKPESQSVATCVLDLQDKFPLNYPYNSDCISWRSLALRLERENMQLQNQLDKEKIKCLTLTAKCDAPASATISTGSSSTSDYLRPASGLACGKSKKTRKKGTSDLHRGEGGTGPLPCLTLLQSSYSSRNDPPPLATLFPVMDALSRLLSHSVSSLPQDLTISNTLRSVEAIADYLDFLILSSKEVHGPKHEKRLDVLNSCLHYVLTNGIPLFVRFSKPSIRKRKRDTNDLQPQENPIDRFLELLRSRIFNRIITTISHLSEVYLTNLLLPNVNDLHVPKANEQARTLDNTSKAHGRSQIAPDDLRAGIVHVFETNIRLLCTCLLSATEQSCAAKSSTLLASLMLSTGCELDKVIFRSPIDPSSVLSLDALDGNYSPIQRNSNRSGNASNRSEARSDTHPRNIHSYQRVIQLAIKDSVWYLCNIVHILFEGRTSVCSKEIWCQTRVGIKNGPEKDIEAINGHRASIILLEATRDILFHLVIKCQKEIQSWNFERAGNIDSLSDSDYQGNEYASSRCVVQASDFKNDNIDDLEQQIGLDAVSDTDMLARKRGGKNIQQWYATRPNCKDEIGQAFLPKLDEVMYNMILGVVERFVLDAYHDGAEVQ